MVRAWTRTILIIILSYCAVVASSTKFTCTCESVETPKPTPKPPLPSSPPPAPAVPKPTPKPTCPPPQILPTHAPTPPPTPGPNSTNNLPAAHGIHSRGPFKCISVYGLETNLRNVVCSWKHPPAYYIEKSKLSGFNTIRVPISMQYVVEGNYDVLDDVFTQAAKFNISVILDFHRVGNNRQEEDWDKGIQEYNGISSRQEFINAILSIVGRYEKIPQFIGMNSWNEYTGRNVQYKKDWDKFVFDDIEDSFPGRFLFFAVGLFWGGTLEGYSLEDLPYKDRIYYGVHKYHFSGTGDRGDWEKSFGTLYPPEKLMIGEYGFRDPEDMDWGRRFVSYLKEKNIKNHCFWTIAHSGDTGGLWKDDCDTLNQNKLDVLKPILG